MAFIQNVPKRNIPLGWHIEPGPKSILIQIVDPLTKFPSPKYQFSEVHQFQFFDVEERGPGSITDADADRLVDILKRAVEHDMNVVVHCHAGVCRSGAVAEVGIILGLKDTEAFRSPNLLVKHLLMRKLGLTYDADEPYTENGRPFIYDELNNKVFL